MECKYKELLEFYFDEHMEEILRDFHELVSIKSVACENSPEKPFGAGCAKALKWGKRFMESFGMHTKEFDGYAVRGDFFVKGDISLGILAHLDTVPAGDGWNTPPFCLTKKEDILYGRGAIDDKGPAIAVLWAAKAIRKLKIPVGNFRIILGGNEENGCKDIEYYQSKEKFPKNVFTPDGSFPVLNCEKGLVHLKFYALFDDSKISEIHGGSVINAIPNQCRVIYKNGEKICVYGKSSHASRPDWGDNAVTKWLQRYANTENPNPAIANLAQLFPYDEFNGKSCGLGFSDSISGEMSCALTTLNAKNGKIVGGIDIRFPINKNYQQIKTIICNKLYEMGFKIYFCEGMEPHYVSSMSKFVQTLLNVYENVKGEKGFCISEGGITYAHNIPGAVAFGGEFPNENNNMHGVNEHISLETFKYNLNLYANAIVELTMED